jgi:hypothetical protein
MKFFDRFNFAKCKTGFRALKEREGQWQMCNFFGKNHFLSVRIAGLDLIRPCYRLEKEVFLIRQYCALKPVSGWLEFHRISAKIYLTFWQ